MAALPPDAVALAASSHHLLTRAQLCEDLGLGGPAVDNLVRTGVLEVLSPGQYRVSGSPASVHQDLLALVRRFGAHAADDTVLGLHGAPGFPLKAPFALAVPRSRRIRLPGITVVRVDLGPADVELVDAIPAMTIERALISLLPRTRTPRFRSAFHDLRRRGLLDVAVLERRAVALGDAPGAAAMRHLLATGGLLSESPPEAELGGIWHPGDPRPAPQVWISHAGRSYRLDWVFLDSRLAPEYDGEAAHGGRSARHRDARRTMALAARGIHRVPVTAPMLRDAEGLRRDLLAVHEERLRSGMSPLAPEAPPAWWNGL